MSNRVKVKVDGNQNAIVDALFAAGYRVQALSQGMGVPDLLCCAPDGHMTLLECKMPGEKPTPYQVKWIATWPAPVYVVHTPDEALAAMRRAT
jgi:hypothetical protein